MSETQHTPGPWSVGMPGRPRDVTLLRPHSVVGSHFDGRGVAVVFGDPGTHEANALLMAAAPDLLEALQSARDFVLSAIRDRVRLPDFDPTQHKLIVQIDAALAKVKGVPEC